MQSSIANQKPPKTPAEPCTVGVYPDSDAVRQERISIADFGFLIVDLHNFNRQSSISNRKYISGRLL